jgi:large repetitive protein
VQAVVLISLIVLVFNCKIRACSAASPARAIVINNGAQFTNSTKVTLTLNASAFYSIVPSTAEMRISNYNQTEAIWEPYSTVKSWTLTSGDGLKTVYFRIRLDSNSAPSQVQFGNIILDMTPPLLEITSPLINETGLDSSFFQVNWRATDAGSGVNHAEVSLDNGKGIDVGTIATFNFTELTNGTHTFVIRVVDNAGNSQTTSKSVTINVTSSTPTPTSSSTSLEGGLTMWLIVGGIAAAVAIAVVRVLMSRKELKGTRRS